MLVTLKGQKVYNTVVNNFVAENQIRLIKFSHGKHELDQ